MIGPYTRHPARFLPCEPDAAEAALSVAAAICGLESTLTVEHVGSTAIPGCGGKGVIDLAVLYRRGGLDRAKSVLDELGFQPQPGPDPFPESRPMRVGSVEWHGRTYQLHAHVIEMGCAEHTELVAFRDTLRADAALCLAYQARKRAIIDAGVTDTAAYASAKSGFVHDVLSEAKADNSPSL